MRAIWLYPRGATPSGQLRTLFEMFPEFREGKFIRQRNYSDGEDRN